MHARCWLETATIEPETVRNRTPEENPENSSLIHVRRLLWKGNGTPLQYSCLENPMDRGA